MTIEIRKPVSLHEHFAEQFHQRDAVTGAITPDAAIEAAVAGLRGARELVQQISASYDAIMSDGSRNVPARYVAARQMVLKLSQQASHAIDKARERMLAELSRIRQDTAAPKPPPTATEEAIETEITARLAGMSGQKRNELIANAIESDDDRTLSAILRAPPGLVGRTDGQIERHREMWRRKRFPLQVERERRIGRALEALEIGGAGLVRWVDSVLVKLDASTEDSVRSVANAIGKAEQADTEKC